jgi:hypothetical protein
MKLFEAQWGAKGPIAVVALGLFSIASLAQAHAMVRSVSIAEGATLTAAPPNLVIVFDHDAGLDQFASRRQAAKWCRWHSPHRVPWARPSPFRCHD